MNAYYSHQKFYDSEEHARSVVNFDQNYFQIEKGAFTSTLTQFDLDGLHVFGERANRRIVEFGQVLPGSITFAWANGATTTPTFQGREVTERSVGFVRGGDDYMLHMPAETDLVGITLSMAEFERLAETGLTAIRKGMRQPLITAGTRASALALSRLYTHFGNMTRHAEQLSCADVRTAIRSQILDSLFTALGDSDTPTRCDLTRLTYSDIVKRGQDFALANTEHPTSVLDLCSELKVCRRTLQKSFQHVAGQSPLAYLRSVRLGGVRRLLRSTSATDMSIGDAAARWGLFHLGHFAKDYRHQFGELPSQTKRFGSS